MKKLLMAAAVIGSVVFFSSCNSAGSSDPKAVLISFFDALSKKDISAARKYATAESKTMLDMMEMGMKAGADKDAKDEKYDKSNMEFGEPKIDGDKATIEVKEKTSGEATNFTMKKEGGAWKVAFDKASMMNMGMDKIKEKGIDNMDMNSIDSLGDKIKDGLEKIDENKEKVEDAVKKLQELGEGDRDTVLRTTKEGTRADIYENAVKGTALDTTDALGNLTRAAFLDKNYKVNLKAGDWEKAAEFLNGFSKDDIIPRLLRLTKTERDQLHQGALTNPAVGPASQIAMMTTP